MALAATAEYLTSAHERDHQRRDRTFNAAVHAIGTPQADIGTMSVSDSGSSMDRIPWSRILMKMAFAIFGVALVPLLLEQGSEFPWTPMMAVYFATATGTTVGWGDQEGWDPAGPWAGGE